MKLTVLKLKAQQLDDEDPLQEFKSRYQLPLNKIYLCNNSLGLPVKSSFALMQKQMQKWSELGAHGWFEGEDNWFHSLDKSLRERLSDLIGAKHDEIAIMNSLTVNLHLLLVSFYQPTTSRFKIMIDAPTFPSDLYAIKSHLINHGLDPETSLLIVEPRQNEVLIRQEDIEQMLAQEGESVAIVFFSSVNYLTGQAFDMKRLTSLAHQQGCLVGWDLAHAAGNIPLHLHEQEIDFAVGCTYKYLCSGPGGPGFAYIHSVHHHKTLPRLSGWWGNNPATRFQMDKQKEFVPYGGANSWQVSTPSILALSPLIASLEVMSEVGMLNFRKKSELQTAYLLELLATIKGDFSIITPLHPEERGCQVSIKMHQDAVVYLARLSEKSVICDFRPPDIIRITPSPLYNSFNEIYQFILRFSEALSLKNP
jgi:kynureninase